MIELAGNVDMCVHIVRWKKNTGIREFGGFEQMSLLIKKDRCF